MQGIRHSAEEASLIGGFFFGWSGRDNIQGHFRNTPRNFHNKKFA